MKAFCPVLVQPPGEIPRLGEPMLDEYLRFVAARARSNTLLAQMFDLKVFFTVVGKEPPQVTTTSRSAIRFASEVDVPGRSPPSISAVRTQLRIASR
jgi:hypothetical protein